MLSVEVEEGSPEFTAYVADLVKRSGLTCDDVYRAVSGGEEYEIEDAPRMVAACHAAGLKITAGEARAAWRKHSQDFFAGWLHLPESDDVLVERIRYWHKRDLPDMKKVFAGRR